VLIRCGRLFRSGGAYFVSRDGATTRRDSQGQEKTKGVCFPTLTATMSAVVRRLAERAENEAELRALDKLLAEVSRQEV
jgi:hypothetical protein